MKISGGFSTADGRTKFFFLCSMSRFPNSGCLSCKFFSSFSPAAVISCWRKVYTFHRCNYFHFSDFNFQTKQKSECETSGGEYLKTNMQDLLMSSLKNSIETSSPCSSPFRNLFFCAWNSSQWVFCSAGKKALNILWENISNRQQVSTALNDFCIVEKRFDKSAL